MADDKGIDWDKFEVASSPAPPAAPHAPPRDTVVVHCPNGHRLVVPAVSIGKMGKCAKCQAAFRISPAAESKVAAAAPAAAQHAGAAGAPSAEPPSFKPADADPGVSVSGPITATSAVQAAGDVGEPVTAASPEAAEPRSGPASDQSGSPPSVAELVTRLWGEVERGGVVELHIEGGSVILPKWFERRWSAGTHGLFASQAADGTVTLTAVAWASIQRILVRNMDDLPEGMFE